MDWTMTLAWTGLAFFWVHTILMAAHAHMEGRSLRGRTRIWSQAGLYKGRVIRGDGPQGRLAVHQVEQTGRSRGDSYIHFHDRCYTSIWDGGAIELEDGEIVELQPHGYAEVWIPPSDQRRYAGTISGVPLDSAYEAARKARGYVRVLEHAVVPGDRVWVYDVATPGETRRDAADATSRHVGIRLSTVQRAVLATFDPRPWLRRRAWLASLAACGIVAAAVAVTVPIFAWEPFGFEAKLGALGAVIVFNLQQLALKWVRDATREPFHCHVRGRWPVSAKVVRTPVQGA